MALLITSFALLASAAAAPPADAPAAQAGNQSAPRERRVCRSEASVGSMFRRRQCMTPTEWAAYDRENGDQTRQTQDDASRNNRSDAWYGPSPQ